MGGERGKIKSNGEGPPLTHPASGVAPLDTLTIGVRHIVPKTEEAPKEWVKDGLMMGEPMAVDRAPAIVQARA